MNYKIFLCLKLSSLFRYIFKRDFLVGKNCRVSMKGKIIKNTNSVLFINYFDDSCPFFDKGYFFMSKNAQLAIDKKNYILTGCRIVLYEDSSLKLNGVFINYSSQIFCKKEITIGNNTYIGPECVISDTDFHSINEKRPTKPISIGRDVWIGRRVQIMKGVKVGFGAVVAAGSIVTKDVPDHSLVAGVPARIIRSNVSWRK